VQFVGVAWTGDDESFRDFIDEHGLTFPQISDDPGVVFDRFQVPYQPGWAFVRADGSYEQVNGVVDDAELTERVADLLATA